MIAPARSTSQEHFGSRGGTFVAMRKHWQPVGVVRQGDVSNDSQIGPAEKAGLDLSAAVVRMRGVGLVIACMYLQHTIVLTGESVTKMRQVVEYLICQRMPFFVYGEEEAKSWVAQAWRRRAG